MSNARKKARMRKLFDIQNGVCPLCECEMTHPDTVREAGMMHHPDAPSIDHIIPQAHGGPNIFTNIMLVHRGCNEERGTSRLPKALILDQFKAKRAAGYVEPQMQEAA